MEQPFPAYKGNEPYVFVCYAHADSEIVYPELVWLKEHGCHIWYDEGIAPGEEWTEELAHAIKGASHLLYLVTPDSIQSRKCRDEINFALDHDIHLVSVHLMETQLSDGLSLTLGLTQAILRYELNEQDYHTKLFSGIGAPLSEVPTASPVQQTSNNSRLISAGFGLVILAILGIGLLLYSKSTSKTSEIEEPPVAESEAMPITASTAGPATVDVTPSIAVLPFVNMSNDPDNEYFSDGISEELLHTLAKIRQLRVAARTSSFAFKGKNQDITEIGNRLNVDTVLEGSVRKSGKRVRITAQLINVEDGFHIWSDTYDRDLTDIFAIQDEISAAIVDALKVHLSDGETTAKSQVIEAEAYNSYLLARYNFRRRTENSLNLAVKQYGQAIDIDPGYAAAWAGKASATVLLSENQYGTLPHSEALRQAQMMLDSAFSLDPNLGEAHATQALLHFLSNNPNPTWPARH